MVAVRELLDVARSQLGVVEQTGKNDGIPAQRYNSGDELPWCAAFVLWCFKQCGLQIPGNHWTNRAVHTMYQNCLKTWGIRCEPLPGAIVFFNSRIASDPLSGGWHTGIVEKVKDLDVVCIEGNVRNAVARCHHSRADRRIQGFAFSPDFAVK